MKMTSRLCLTAIVLFCSTCVSCRAERLHAVSFEKPAELQAYLKWRPGRLPLIGAHRGGPSPGYPENCLATFEKSLRLAPCLIECDVRKSKDGALVLMHDRSLDRTTTGKGLVETFSLAQLKRLNLTDPNGVITPHKIPTLSEALLWARGKAILELDIKGEITPEEVVQAIGESKAEACVVVITYDIPTAQQYHGLDDRLVLSCSARGVEGTVRLLESGIPPANLLAFVGVYEPPKEVYALLHKKGVCAILGTMGNLDRKARRAGGQTYIDLVQNGADVLATDDVELAAEALERTGRLPEERK